MCSMGNRRTFCGAQQGSSDSERRCQGTYPDNRTCTIAFLGSLNLNYEPSIHQYIFAGPKPGLGARAFQSYWVNFHAVDFAAKIPQIKRYLVATRENVEAPRQMDFFQGIAEIWLQSDAEQIASMQTSEFLQGARADEPRWAAFWQTFVLDTESTVVKQGGQQGKEFVN